MVARHVGVKPRSMALSAPQTRRARVRLHDDNRRWWTLAAMCFALFMLMLDNTVVNVALPAIQRGLGASLSGLEWTVNAYTLAFAVFLVTGGRLGDIFGRRRAFLVGVTVFALASAAVGAAPNEGLLVAARAIQGLAGALVMPATLSLVTTAFPPEERGKAIGTWAGVSGLALALGPVVGGALTEYVSWRAIFYLNLPVAAGAVAMTLYSTRESRDDTAERRVDFAGIVTLSAGLTVLVLALIEGNRWGWASAAILGLLAGAVAALAVFAALERRVPAPMVDFTFFRSRSFFGANLAGFIVTFAMFGMFFFLALYMQNLLGLSPLQTGVRFLPTTIAVIVTSPLAGRLADRIGARIPLTCGLAITAGSLALTSRIDVTSGYGRIFPALLIMGVGIGFTMAPLSTAAMNAVSHTKAGVASGVLAMSRMVGATFGVAALGALIQHLAAGRSAHTPRDAFIHAFSGGMWMCAGVALVGALAAWTLVDRRPAAGYADASSAAPVVVPER
jgi:EmrB/QacA subfamily drug resistance transporter